MPSSRGPRRTLRAASGRVPNASTDSGARAGETTAAAARAAHHYPTPGLRRDGWRAGFGRRRRDRQRRRAAGSTVLGVPCVTLRAQTEWPSTVNRGTNSLAAWPPTVASVVKDAQAAIDRRSAAARARWLRRAGTAGQRRELSRRCADQSDAGVPGSVNAAPRTAQARLFVDRPLTLLLR